MSERAFARWVAVLAAAFFVVAGVWAMVAPRSFFDNLATFPPYNEHLLHDVGAFQIGLGAVLILAVVGWSSLAATLGGVALGSALHAGAHVIDRHEGGRDTDPVLLSLFAALILAAAIVARARGASLGAPAREAAPRDDAAG